MHHRLLRFALGGVCTLLTTAVSLLIAYAIGFWRDYNIDNLWYLLKLTIPYALLVAVVAVAWPEPHGKRGATPWFVLVILGVGPGCGYWFFLARSLGVVLMGLWIQAVGSWSAAGAAALLLALRPRSYAVLASAVLICVLGVVVPTPTFNLVEHNQDLTVAIVVPEGVANVPVHPEHLRFHSQSELERAVERVLQVIRASGLQGDYRVVYLSREGQGKQSLAILVVNAPVTGRALLAEPDAADVIYVQQLKGWTKIPAQAPTLRRNIEIEESGNDRSSLAYFEISDANGISLAGRVRTAEAP
jgi:hypothetical protein